MTSQACLLDCMREMTDLRMCGVKPNLIIPDVLICKNTCKYGDYAEQCVIWLCVCACVSVCLCVQKFVRTAPVSVCVTARFWVCVFSQFLYTMLFSLGKVLLLHPPPFLHQAPSSLLEALEQHLASLEGRRTKELSTDTR